MAVKKTELYSSLWAGCDELRGGMDASQYKNYVLTLLFMKYISDKYAGDKNAIIVIPDGASFNDLLALKNNKEIGDKINKTIGKLAEKNELKGVIDVADFNDEDKLGKGKEMVDRLSNLLGIFEGIDLSANRAEGDDLLGDAYEYLMRHFATESGKSKGQFYTPAEVSRILAKVVGITPETRQDGTVYDPTCGSGSLLLKVANEAPNGLTIYGQEMDNATVALAKMNMILHDSPTAVIWKDNTLAAPYWKNPDGSLKTFDFAVANPPFSYKSWSNGVSLTNDEFNRFNYGVPPDKNGDYAFLLHILKSLKTTGKAAIILPHGVLFRGNAEARIRKNLITQGYIKGIIGLPANLFYGTGIPACIIVIDKSTAATRKGLFMVDGSKGFIKDGNKNRLRSQDIHKIVDVFNHQIELPRYSRMVSLKEIATNDYNLNIPRYIDSSEPEDIHNLSAHLNGGIPNADIDALENYWRVFPQLRSVLFTPSQFSGYSESLVDASRVKTTILNHPEFTTFAKLTLALYQAWQNYHEKRLKNIAIGDKPKALIALLSEDLLKRFVKAELLDKYDIYQLLMDYWEETMQDDVYILVQDSWEAGKVLRELVAKKGEKLKEAPDLIIDKKKYKADLIPPGLIVARYFAKQQQEIDEFQTDLDVITQELEALIEEHTGEDGALVDAQTDTGKVTKNSIKKLIGDSKQLSIFEDLELSIEQDDVLIIYQCFQLFEQEETMKKKVKEAQIELDKAVLAQYPKLTEDEIKTLVINDKWGATLEGRIIGEIERVTQQLASRIKELDERYAEPLSQLVDEVEMLSSRVDEHLKRMGVSWN
ncbi:type I restriction-modification system subunit M [Planktothrix agardhii]|uniref:type I restriction-modification system subunit M n=1 Tax=Planktothrix agardhii TaxID=1160 RepID=UPI0020B2B66F|nr:type I restriction-modification system subunit M [Planktothrix agardhii]CAD5984755.1 Type I restriction enzyme EcoR124II M protein [Planktothrix agardhii]